MGRVLQLSNADNWTSVYDQSFTALQITPTLHDPIPEVTIPILLESHVLAVYVSTTPPDGAEWFFAGFINQRFQLGLVVGGLPEADNLARRKVYLDRIQLVLFPKLTSTYSCTFNFPKWFKNGRLQLWQYDGPDYESSDVLLQTIASDLAEIKSVLVGE